MTIYLTIITTLLVITQVVRVVQNHISLHRQEEAIKKDLLWIKDNEITEKDFETQKRAYELIVEYLKERMVNKHGTD